MANPTTSARTADLAIIGGGLIGCSIALRLAQASLKVMVFDRGEPGSEASTAAAGMVAPQGETAELGAFFDLCAESRDLYSQFVSEIEELSGQKVEYRRDGTLLVALDEGESQELEEIYRGQTRVGLRLERWAPTAVQERVRGLSPSIQCGLFIPGDHWVDNEQLVQAVIRAGEQAGVTFHAHAPVSKLHVRNGRVESVEAGDNSFSAGVCILAAGCWSEELVAPLGIKLRTTPCRGQIIEFDCPIELPVVVRAGFHYLLPRAGMRVLVGTTVEYVGYEKAVTGEGLESILAGVRRIAPFVKSLPFRRAWAGLRPDTADHLPILGYGELKNLVFATGHFRNGILLAPVTAKLISELVLKGSTPRPIDAYLPTRFAR